MLVRLKAVGWVERLLKVHEQNFSFEGETLGDLLSALNKNIKEPIKEESLVILVNGVGRRDAASCRLKDGDTVTLLPVMSGG